jgi:hypothetical protein
MTIGLSDWQGDDRPARLGWLLALPFRPSNSPRLADKSALDADV